jgi:hypothetical protein
MASATNDNAIPPIPSLPPLVGIDGRRYEDVLPQIFPGQNSPPRAVALSKNTPPPFCINAGHSDQPSAMSSLTATNNVSTPAASRTRGRDNSGSSGRLGQCQQRWQQREARQRRTARLQQRGCSSMDAAAVVAAQQRDVGGSLAAAQRQW